MAQPIIINLHPNKYNQGLYYYPFAVNLDRCAGSCNTLKNLSNKVCVPNKTEVFNMITGINESKTLTKHISCKCTCNLLVENATQIKSGIIINVGTSVKHIIYLKKIISGILLHVV